MNKFYRTKQGCYGLVNNPYWGRYYRTVPDPAGVEVPDCIDDFMLADNFAKMPAKLLYAIVNFFRRFEKKNIEAQVILLRGEIDVTQWDVVVPLQTVSGASVNSNAKSLCNLFTGEMMSEYPSGWVYAGTMHLHPGVLDAYWSSVDDRNELNNPGMHCTIGRVSENKFNICCSICLRGNRYVFAPDLLIDDVFLLAENKQNSTLLYVDDNIPAISPKAYEQVKEYSYVKIGAKTSITPKILPDVKLSGYEYWWDTGLYNDDGFIVEKPVTQAEILANIENYLFSATPDEVDELFEKISTYFF
jgi:hypothetical protein